MNAPQKASYCLKWGQARRSIGPAADLAVRVSMHRYVRFKEFYPFYLSEHRQCATRRLHFVGSALSLVCLVALIATANPWWLLAALMCGYGFAWISHLTVEKNRPATFKYPLYSFMGDWVMFWQMLTGRIAF